jgi:hypothetical protein
MNTKARIDNRIPKTTASFVIKVECIDEYFP